MFFIYFIVHADQCDINNGGCDHICANGQCQCFTGYRLGSDGRSCNGESSIQHDQQHCIVCIVFELVHTLIWPLSFRHTYIHTV